MKSPAGLRFVVFGRGLASTWRDGAATGWRALLSALSDRGHAVSFFAPEDPEAAAHADLSDPLWGQRRAWSDEAGLARCLAAARGADVIVKASGAGDRALDEAVLELRGPDNTVLWWDLGHAPPTAVSRWDAVVTASLDVGPWRLAGAREVLSAPPSFDPSVHRPPRGPAREGITWLGARCPADEAALARWAAGIPLRIAGAGWEEALPSDAVALGHVDPRGHADLLGGSLAVLNLRRPTDRTEPVPARIMEAAGCGGCVVTEPFPGLDTLFAPGREILVVQAPGELAEVLAGLTPEASGQIGRAARARALNQHTNDRAAVKLERLLSGVDRDVPLARGAARG